MKQKHLIAFGFLWVLRGVLSLQAQTPVAYWNFEEEDVRYDVVNEVNSRFRTSLVAEEQAEAPTYQDVRVPKGEIANSQRKFLRLNRESSDNYLMDSGMNRDGLTLSFFFRLPRTDFNPNCRLFSATDYSLYTHLRTNSLQFSTRVLDEEGQMWAHNMYIPLDGAGKNSYEYFLDNEWHHLVFKYDAKSGLKEVWVDGEVPEGFSTRIDKKGERICRDSRCSSQLILGHQAGSSEGFIGDIDEIVLFDRFVDEDIHLQHYIQFWENTPLTFRFNNQRYGYEVRRIKKRNQEGPFSQAVRSLEPVNSEYPTSIFSSEMEPLAQLKGYPLPRYASGHQMHRLYSWISYSYLSGLFREEIGKSKAVPISYSIQEEMALHWNYLLDLGNSVVARNPAELERDDRFLKNWIDLANKYPDIPLGLTTLWPQTRLSDIGEEIPTPYVMRKDLPEDYYLKTVDGEFLAKNGVVNPDLKYISPAAKATLLKKDGKAQKLYIESILKKLTRPLNFINENGEVSPYPIRGEVLAMDPTVVKEKVKLSYENWDAYQAYKKTSLRKLYSDQFLSAVPKSYKTTFTWYGIDGGDTPNNRFYWNEAKKILTKINGKYYSTTDFYPREPKFWETGAGPWHGWNWMEKTRKVEILAGDPVCSPFIAAGWSKDSSKNIRPSQWLGLLKNLSVIGSEFFYVGFFNESIGKYYPDPRNYTWQLSTPAYAQAISSYYEDILKEGHLLTDEEGNPIFRYWAGDPRVVVTIRKHEEKELYAIACSINPNSNTADNVAVRKNIIISFLGEEMTMEVRKQGSVYMLDLTDSTTPTFWQLDSWHETGHPVNWKAEMAYEAEVYEAATDMKRVTVKDGEKLDFRSFTTFVKAETAKATVSYTIPGRSFNSGKAILTLAVANEEKRGGNIRVLQDGKEVGKFTLKRSNQGLDENGFPSATTYSMELDGIDPHGFTLTFSCSSSGILLDKFVLTPR
ncbi:MAG: hypothetical protein AAF824_01545 [Bacteroidota bacterium]